MLILLKRTEPPPNSADDVSQEAPLNEMDYTEALQAVEKGLWGTLQTFTVRLGIGPKYTGAVAHLLVQCGWRNQACQHRPRWFKVAARRILHTEVALGCRRPAGDALYSQPSRGRYLNPFDEETEQVRRSRKFLLAASANPHHAALPVSYAEWQDLEAAMDLEAACRKDGLGENVGLQALVRYALARKKTRIPRALVASLLESSLKNVDSGHHAIIASREAFLRYLDAYVERHRSGKVIARNRNLAG